MFPLGHNTVLKDDPNKGTPKLLYEQYTHPEKELILSLSPPLRHIRVGHKYKENRSERGTWTKAGQWLTWVTRTDDIWDFFPDKFNKDVCSYPKISVKSLPLPSPAPLYRAHNWTLFPLAKISFNVFIMFKTSFILSLATISRTSTILCTMAILERKFHKMLKTLVIRRKNDSYFALAEQSLGRVRAIFRVEQQGFHSAVSDE